MDLLIKYSARDICKDVGYKKWDKFLNTINKAIQLINNGQSIGIIKQTSASKKIGSGAKRDIIDFEIDKDALDLIYNIAGRNKLTNPKHIRNETQILTLLKKYCEHKGVGFEFQFKIDNYFFDALVGPNNLLEFDEPHHLCNSQSRIDTIKNEIATKHSFNIFRFDIYCDIVDIIKSINI